MMQPSVPARWTIAVWMAPALVWCAADSGAAPRYKQSSPASSTDLLTDGLDALLNPGDKAEQAGPTEKAGPAEQPRFAPDQQLLNDLIEDSLNGEESTPDWGEDIGKQKEDPLKRIHKNMGVATRLIDRQAESGQTRNVQKQIITDLDELIKKMEKQCNCSGSGQCDKPSSSRQQSKRSKPKQAQQPKPSQKAGNKQGQPKNSQAKSAAQQSTTRLGSADGQAAPGRSPEELLKDAWGHLPQRLREQMLQSSSDEFLPQYREEIENYFRRLAEEEAKD